MIVGVNRFAEDGRGGRRADILRIDPALERAQVERVRALRARRDAARLARPRSTRSSERARDGGNLMPALVDAVLAWATVGEIAGRLRAVFGEHRETLVCELRADVRASSRSARGCAGRGLFRLRPEEAIALALPAARPRT